MGGANTRDRKGSQSLPASVQTSSNLSKSTISFDPSQDPDESSIYYHPVYFTFNDDKPKQVACRALYDYNAMRNDELSFCKDAVITNVEKHEGGWWRGDYGRRKKRWFPANYVQEIDVNDPSAEERQLGNLQQGAIDIGGCMVEAHGTPVNDMYMLRIYPKSAGPDAIGRPAIEVGAATMDDMLEWRQAIEDVRNKAESQEQELLKLRELMKSRERTKKIAREISEMVIYCWPVPFQIESKWVGSRGGVRGLPKWQWSCWRSF